MTAMDSGVYEIVNTVNGKRYIGSAVSLPKRWAEHKRDLSLGRHHSKALQRAWAKYGSETFKFGVIFHCQKADLISFEQVFLDELRPAYNICRFAGSSLGLKHSAETRAKMSAARTGRPGTTKGRKYSPEICARMGAPKRGRKKGPMPTETKAKLSAAKRGKPNPKMLGHVVSAETRAKISEANIGKAQSPDACRKRARLTDDQARDIRRMRLGGTGYTEIAAKYGIVEQLVCRICLRERYKWVDPEEAPIVLPRSGRVWSDEAKARHPKKEQA